MLILSIVVESSSSTFQVFFLEGDDSYVVAIDLVCPWEEVSLGSFNTAILDPLQKMFVFTELELMSPF